LKQRPLESGEEKRKVSNRWDQFFADGIMDQEKANEMNVEKL
jgi:hypothetical protein